MLTDALSKAIAELEEEEVLRLVKERLEKGEAPLDIVSALQAGMTHVGELFETGEYFLSELVMVGEIMKDAMKILEPHLAGETGEHKGTIVIGTVHGDIHDLGKDIVVMLLRGAGYNVIDLGVDVPKEKFVEAIKESNAPLVGMSVLLTTCQDAMKESIEAIKEAGLNPKIMIGGNYTDETVRKYVGADFCADAAGDGLRYANEVFGQ